MLMASSVCSSSDSLLFLEELGVCRGSLRVWRRGNTESGRHLAYRPMALRAVSRLMHLPQVAEDLVLEPLHLSLLVQQRNGGLRDFFHDASRELPPTCVADQL